MRWNVRCDCNRSLARTLPSRRTLTSSSPQFDHHPIPSTSRIPYGSDRPSYIPMPVPLPPEQRSTFTDADLYPSSSLHRMRTHITVSLQNGDFAGALKIYQRLRGRYTGGRQAQDGKLAKSIEARDNARWLESIFARVEEAPEETLKTASDWLRCSDGAALSGHVHAVTLSGLLSVAEVAEEADDYDLRRRAVGRTISLLAKLCRDESQLLECLTDPVFDSYRADRSDLIEVLLSFSSSNQQTVIALREVASSITKARRDAGEPIREEVDVRHTLATEPGQEPSVTEDVDADTLPPLSEPPLATMEVSSIPTFGMAYLRTIIQGSLTDTKRQPLRERQIALEDAIAECGVLRAQRLAVSSGSSFQTRLSGVQTQASRWMKELEEELSNDVAQFWRDVRAKAVVPHDQPTAQVNKADAEDLLEPSEIAEVAIARLFQLMLNELPASAAHGHIPEAKASRIVGVSAARRATLSAVVRNDPSSYLTKTATFRSSILKGNITENIRNAAYRAKRQAGEEAETERTMKWPNWFQKGFGETLVDYMQRATTVTTTDEHGLEIVKPAFERITVTNAVVGHMKYVLSLEQKTVSKLLGDGIPVGLDAGNFPMLLPPQPWTSLNSGGYLTRRYSAIRGLTAESTEYLRLADQRGDLRQLYAALDVLGSTCWTVNGRVLDVLIQAWNDNLSIGKLIPRQTKSIPEMPSLEELDEAARKKEKRKWTKKVADIERENGDNYSNRVSAAYTLQQALMLYGERFWVPHNLDFRGRAYPLPAYLSPTNNDFNRAIMLFAEGKPLGERGLIYLKAQVAGMCGVDKVSYDDRVAWVESQLDKIFDSADHPLEGKGWWQKQDKPWQCLASCIELTNALRSSDPTQYVCRLPIQLDGTCNGLQHYAALGRDIGAAASVSLNPGPVPGDVYTTIAKGVMARIDEEVAVGVKEEGSQALSFDRTKREEENAGSTSLTMAKMLQGKIKRKHVKQPVMTTTYGVTAIGAAEQVLKQLEALDTLGPVDGKTRRRAAFYIGKKIRESLTDVFTQAIAIQDWFNRCIRLIVRSSPADHCHVGDVPVSMTSVVWTTPLGLPVVQQYRKGRDVKSLGAAIESFMPEIKDPSAPPAEIDVNAQLRAFPPNYIHSLDATHMMRTALSAKKRGLTFASVHDSYWSHAADSDTLAELLREEFVAIHSRSLLDDLRNEWLARYGDYLIHRTRIPESEKQAQGDLLDELRENGSDAPGELADSYIPLRHLLPDPPPVGEFDINLVRGSTYFFN